MPYRPGIPGAATLAFRCEEELLSHVHASQLDDFYNQHIRLLKGRMDIRYMGRATFWSDLRLIGAKFLACVLTPRVPTAFRHASTRAMTLRPQPASEGQRL